MINQICYFGVVDVGEDFLTSKTVGTDCAVNLGDALILRHCAVCKKTEQESSAKID